jgi:uncharacterized phage-associated protein
MNVYEVALYFLNRSLLGGNFAITHLKLQKLVYYAQAWSMAINQRPLFDTDIEAWLHGPVSRELYREYREYGFREIPPVENLNIRIERNDLEVLQGVWDLYGEHDGKYLETLAHQEDPWINAWNLGMNHVIDLNEMEQFYGQMLGGRAV